MSDDMEHGTVTQVFRERVGPCLPIAQMIGDAILGLDRDGKILFVNESTEQIFGYSADELVGQPFAQLVPAHLRELPAIAIQEYFAKMGKPFATSRTEILGLRRNGQTIPLELSFGSSATPNGYPFIAFLRDISDQKQAQEARLRLAAIVESSDDAIISKDLNGIVTSWNAGAERIFGYTAEEIVGRPITLIIPPELQSDETRILEVLKRGERINHFETIRVTKSGQRINVSLTVSPVKDERGRVIGAAKIARNITQQKQMEEALRISERLASVGRLAATIAHEINNPLEAIVNLVYLAKNSPGISSPAREYLAAAEEELDRVTHLTKQTLGFYREQKGAGPTRIGLQMRQLLALLSSKIKKKGIAVRLKVADDPEIIAIPSEIRQLLANILTNSIDATPPRGTIEIRISHAVRWRNHAPSVRITVADSGPGISPAHRPRIFEPFFTTKTDVGTGLGLWICRSIVARHAGKIQVKSSTAPGRSWTAVSVLLPLNPQPPEDLLTLASAI